MKMRGFTAKKKEIAQISDTGEALIQRKIQVKDLSDPSQTQNLKPTSAVSLTDEEVEQNRDALLINSPFGAIGESVWWRESLRMRKADARIKSIVTALSIERVKNVLVWSVTLKRVD